MAGSGRFAEIQSLILQAAIGARQLSPAELQSILEGVAQAGFDSKAREAVRGVLAGLTWRGNLLKGSDRISPAERHYLRHVVLQQEWPSGTTLYEYVGSLRKLVLDPSSGAFTSRYQGAWQFGVIRESGDLRGPGGFEWVLIEYRLTTGHWVTAYQPEEGLWELMHPRRGDVRWLRRPRLTSGLR